MKETVKSDPAQVYGAIERLLEEDLLHRQLGAGLADARASSRGWLEHRSHLSLYPTTVRLLWAVTGIWDCLRAGRHEEARARAALTVAAADQQALDGGSWVLAEHFLLEQGPPLSALRIAGIPSTNLSIAIIREFLSLAGQSYVFTECVSLSSISRLRRS